jgi:hypothetical protein
VLCQANILDTKLRRHHPKQEVVTAAATEARISILCGMLMVLLSTNKLVCRRMFWRDLTRIGTDWHFSYLSPNRERVY